MTCDIVLRNSTIVRRIMARSALSYLSFSAVNEAMALVYVVWLAVGPHEESVRCDFDKVRSCTTDMGTEFLVSNIKDVLPAFRRHLRGQDLPEAALHIDHSRVLMPYCIKIPGFSRLNAIAKPSQLAGHYGLRAVQARRFHSIWFRFWALDWQLDEVFVQQEEPLAQHASEFTGHGLVLQY